MQDAGWTVVCTRYVHDYCTTVITCMHTHNYSYNSVGEMNGFRFWDRVNEAVCILVGLSHTLGSGQDRQNEGYQLQYNTHS